MVLRRNSFNTKFLLSNIEGGFGFQNQMDYVKMAVKDLELTVKHRVDTHIHHDTSGQQNYNKIIRSFLIFPQIKTYRDDPLIQKKIFLCFF